MLSILLESRHLFVSLGDMAQRLEVSLRTVQREIKFLEETLKASGLYLDKKPNEGIRIGGPEEQVDLLKEALKSYNDFELERNERMLLLYTELLKNDEPVKSSTLTALLGISGKTLQQDLEVFSEEIRYCNLTLTRKPGYGTFLVGSEKDKRMGFVNLVLQRMEQFPVFSLQEGRFLSFDQEDRIFSLLDQGRLEVIEKALFAELEQLDYRLTDLALLELLLHLNLSVIRTRQGFLVEDSPKAELSEEDRVAEAVGESLQSQLEITLPTAEIRFIASILSSAKRTRSLEIDENYGLTALATSLIDAVTEATGYYFDRDRRFMDALMAHLEPLLNRIRDGITVLNPIKKEIQEDYAVLFGTLEKILKDKFPGQEISDDEIGFLTLHFASAVKELKEAPKVSTLVVCTSGIATSRMLTKKLLGKFPQLTIIEQGSIIDLKKMDTTDFDLIISTVGIRDAQFEYILVSPMLSEEDARKLERVINDKLLTFSRRKAKPSREEHKTSEGFDPEPALAATEAATGMIRSLLEHFALRELQASSLPEALDQMFADLSLPHGGEAAKAMLLQKARTTGSALPGTRLALIHGRHETVDQPLFRVYRNPQPFMMLGMDGKTQAVQTLLLLLTPQQLGEAELELVSTISIALLERANTQIYETAGEGQIRTLLLDHLKTKYLEIMMKKWR